jgi:hypothetical protein
VDERVHFPLPSGLRRLLAGDDEGAALLQLAQGMSAAELLSRIEGAVAAPAA